MGKGPALELVGGTSTCGQGDCQWGTVGVGVNADARSGRCPSVCMWPWIGARAFMISPPRPLFRCVLHDASDGLQLCHNPVTARSLDYCHRKGVVNRDIKLENTLLQVRFLSACGAFKLAGVKEEAVGSTCCGGTQVKAGLGGRENEFSNAKASPPGFFTVATWPQGQPFSLCWLRRMKRWQGSCLFRHMPTSSASHVLSACGTSSAPL